MARGLRRNRHNGGHHAGTCTAELILQVFTDGRRDTVLFKLRIAVVDDVNHIGVERSEFQVQEETVEPRGVVVR